MIISKTQLKATSYLLVFLFIIIIIPLRLFPCFIAGFLSYEIILFITSFFERFFNITTYSRSLVVILISLIIFILFILGIIHLINFCSFNVNESINFANEINFIFIHIKSRIPDFLLSFFPDDEEVIKKQLLHIVESNIIIIRNIAHTFFHSFITIFIGFIIGLIISINNFVEKKNTYFINQLLERLKYLSQSFHDILSSQLKISLVNTLLTSIMILIIFPYFEIYLPLSKLLIFFTFVFGLIPIVGNVISNIIIVISAITISITIGIIIIIYLVLIHKMEYFLNAKIIGNRIRAKSWELLLAMLLFEATFGLEGLAAAPIYYTYLKLELRAQNLI